jgi:mono/diheme cytochrome c family protein
LAVEDVPEDTKSRADMPIGILYVLLILAAAATIPFSLAAYARESKSEHPRRHIIPDMDWQPKFKSQRENALFADGRAMRPQVDGTIAIGELRDDDHFERGKVSGAWARTFPPQVEIGEDTIAHGQERFGVYCTPCHGQVGLGDGMVAVRATKLAEGTWVPPTNLTEERLRFMPVGELFNTITNGIRNMPGYGRQVDPGDRWAIILYLRALQRSQAAKLDDVPAQARGNLK